MKSPARLSVRDANTGTVQWYGSAAAFFRDNRDGIPAAERGILCEMLREYGDAFIGGGATPLTLITLED